MARLRPHALTGFVVAWVAACGGSNASSTAGDGGPDDATSSSGDSGGGSSSGGSSSGGSGSGGSSSSGSSSGGAKDGGSGGGKDGGSGSGSGGTDAGPPVGASVLGFHNHINRDGFYIDGAITKAVAPTFHRIMTFAGSTAGNVYASPLYVADGPAHKGTFFVATESDVVTAIDEATGNQVWQKTIATPASQTGAGCGNISPIGITGTPAIDLATRLIVFSAASADANSGIATHTIHALSIDDGAEKWNLDVSTLSDPSGVKFADAVQAQNQRGAVLIVNGVAYVVFGGHYGDCGSYHGWVVSVALTGTGAHAWATQIQGAGIWGPGGASSDGQSIYVSTGNATTGNASWSESEGIFRLDAMLGFTKQSADYFAPNNWQALDNGDIDLSGSGPLVVDSPSMTPSALVLAQGKDGYLYLLDRSNLGGIAPTGALGNVGGLQVQSGEITNGGAWANVGSPATTYVVVRPNSQSGGVGCPNGTSGDLVGVKLDPSAAGKMSVAWCASSGGVGSPTITTSDGTNDALVWAFQADQGQGQLLAFDLVTGASVFPGGPAGDAVGNVRRFTTPIAVHGRIYVAGDNQLYAFGP